MNSSIKVDINSAGEFLGREVKFVVPSFARTYVWSRKQAAKLLNDIILQLSKGNDHFLGSLIVNQNQFDTESFFYQYAVIDGQQRLVTLSFIIMALADVAREAGRPEISQELQSRYIALLPRREINPVPKIQLAEFDRPSYTQLISENNISNLNSQNQFKIILKSLRNDIVEYTNRHDNRNESLDALAEHLLHHVIFTVIHVSDMETALRIFETTNQRGTTRNAIEFGTFKNTESKNIDNVFLGASSLKHVFLSYSREDATMMGQIRDYIASTEFKVWTDENLVPGTESWKRSIQEALEASGALIVLVSPDAKQSPWVSREISYARLHNVPIFPVFIRGTEAESITFELVEYQWTDIREQDQIQRGMMKVLKAIYDKLYSPLN